MKHFVIPFLSLLLYGCASISTFQTAKILPHGEMETGFAIGSNNTQLKSSFHDFDVDLKSLSLETWVRCGILDEWELDIKLAVPTYSTMQIRKRLTNNRSLATSFALGYGGADIKASHTIGNFSTEDRIKIQDVIGTYYISKDFSPRFALYASPRGIWRFTKNSRKQTGLPQEKESFDDVLLGAGLGLCTYVKEDTRLMIEYNYVADTSDSDYHYSFWGIGIDGHFNFF